MPKSADYVELEKLKKSLEKPFWKEILIFFIILSATGLLANFIFGDKVEITLVDALGDLVISVIIYIITRAARKEKYKNKIKEMKKKGLNIQTFGDIKNKL